VFILFYVGVTCCDSMLSVLRPFREYVAVLIFLKKKEDNFFTTKNKTIASFSKHQSFYKEQTPSLASDNVSILQT